MYCAAAQNTTAQLACAQCASGIFSMTLGTDTPGYMQHEYVKPLTIHHHPTLACFRQLFPLFIQLLCMANSDTPIFTLTKLKQTTATFALYFFFSFLSCARVT